MQKSKDRFGPVMAHVLDISAKIAQEAWSKAFSGDEPQAFAKQKDSVIGYLTFVATYLMADSLSLTTISSGNLKNLFAFMPRASLHQSFQALPEEVRLEAGGWMKLLGPILDAAKPFSSAYWQKYEWLKAKPSTDTTSFFEEGGMDEKKQPKDPDARENTRRILSGLFQNKDPKEPWQRPLPSLDLPRKEILEKTGQKGIGFEDRYFQEQQETPMTIKTFGKAMMSTFKESQSRLLGHVPELSEKIRKETRLKPDPNKAVGKRIEVLKERIRQEPRKTEKRMKNLEMEVKKLKQSIREMKVDVKTEQLETEDLSEQLEEAREKYREALEPLQTKIFDLDDKKFDIESEVFDLQEKAKENELNEKEAEKLQKLPEELKTITQEVVRLEKEMEQLGEKPVGLLVQRLEGIVERNELIVRLKKLMQDQESIAKTITKGGLLEGEKLLSVLHSKVMEMHRLITKPAHPVEKPEGLDFFQDAKEDLFNSREIGQARKKNKDIKLEKLVEPNKGEVKLLRQKAAPKYEIFKTTLTKLSAKKAEPVENCKQLLIIRQAGNEYDQLVSQAHEIFEQYKQK
jgi:hypothetical protein